MMKKKEIMNRQRRWEGSANEMKHRKASVNWQIDMVELSRKEQVVISRLRTGYTRATHRHIIEKPIYQTAHSTMYAQRRTGHITTWEKSHGAPLV
jgi:hypothetical protein